MRKTFEITAPVTFLFSVDETTPRRDPNRTDAGVALDQARKCIAAALNGAEFGTSYVRSIGGDGEQSVADWREQAISRGSFIQG